MNEPSRSFTFQVLGGRYAVVRLDADAPLPGWATAGDFFSVTRTADELSIVCRRELLPAGVLASADWSCMKLVGPFAFDDTGIVASVTTTIAGAGLGVFVVSTYDGDHILVKAADLDAAVSALLAGGHVVRVSDGSAGQAPAAAG